MATFLDAFFPSYKLHLAHAKFFKRLPYEWNDDQKKIVVNPSPLRKASVRAWIILTGAYVSFQIVNITFGEYSLVKKLTGALILNLNAGCFLLSLELNPESTPIENLNRLLSGEDTQPHIAKPVLAVMQALSTLTVLTYWNLALGFTAMSIFYPCKPPLLGSYILCRVTWPSPVWKWLGTCLLTVFEFAVGMQSTIAGCHYGSLTQISGIVLLFGRCQDFMNSKLRKVDYMVKGYRELQVHERIHNSIYKRTILPVMILAIPLLQVLTGFALIELFQEVTVFQSLIFLVLYVDTILFCLVVFTTAASINVKSEDWMGRVKGRVGKNAKYFRRVRQSFRPLRLEYGDNFVDRMTPLVMQEFCSSQTASLLLTRA